MNVAQPGLFFLELVPPVLMVRVECPPSRKLLGRARKEVVYL
jgi:hypothetical protein